MRKTLTFAGVTVFILTAHAMNANAFQNINRIQSEAFQSDIIKVHKAGSSKKGPFHIRCAGGHFHDSYTSPNKNKCGSQSGKLKKGKKKSKG